MGYEQDDKDDVKILSYNGDVSLSAEEIYDSLGLEALENV